LAPVNDWFTEGFDFAVLKEAKAAGVGLGLSPFLARFPEWPVPAHRGHSTPASHPVTRGRSSGLALAIEALRDRDLRPPGLRKRLYETPLELEIVASNSGGPPKESAPVHHPCGPPATGR